MKLEIENKKCPACGEEILAVAKKCKHCGEWLSDVATQKKMTKCPFCAEEIEEGLKICPLCDEPLSKQTNSPIDLSQKEKPVKKKSKKKKTLWIIVGIVGVIFLYIGIAIFIYTKIGVFDELFNNSTDYAIETILSDSEETSENVEYQLNNNLITPTSIAGIEVLKKSFSKVINEIRLGNPNLTWESFGYEDGEAVIVTNGETHLLTFLMNDKKIIFQVNIFDASLATADGLHVGSTSGDILKLYPKAKVDYHYSDESGDITEYIEVNKIRYYFDYDDDVSGKYSESEGGYSSKILNKKAKISEIVLYTNQ